jgi:biopolymer transport protein ExbD
VFLQADPDVLYEDFMAVLNVLQENGYFKVGIINEDIE